MATSTTCSGRRWTAHRVPADLELGERLGLPAEDLVGHSFEGLADHDELTGGRIAGSQVNVGQESRSTAVAPLRRQHDQVIRVDRLDLAPGLSPSSGFVGRLETLDHHPFVACGDAPLPRSGSPHRHPMWRSGRCDARRGRSDRGVRVAPTSGWSIRSTPSTWSTSKKNGYRGTSAKARSSVPNRLIVS